MTSTDPAASAADVARAFYDAFSRHDAEGMVRLYHPQATFHDAVFGTLTAAQTAAMWRMLLGRSADMTVSAVLLGLEGQTARVRWDAHYKFSSTGRPVHNVVYARLTVQDGLIIRHTDRFNFWVWSRQALGLPGLLLGWTSMLHRRISETALAGLKASQQKAPDLG
ncbi:nuclear transport factor 2 family protein [Deinococcus altitudinis]|uniref:nuclear transport factor 2 family protein n=1 Tax=Deinococcus altitudinis TaxID=468914 RepID=UPI0038918D4C